MHSTPPVEITTHFSIMGLLLGAVVGLGALFVLMMILSTLTGRPHRHQPPAQTSVAHRRPGMGTLIPLFLAGFMCLWVLFLYTFTARHHVVHESETVVAQTSKVAPPVLVPSVRATPPRQQPRGRSEPESVSQPGISSTAEELVATSERDTDPLPEWTQKSQTVLNEGQVPRILFVETSGLYSSEDEALAEATTNAVRKFRARLAETYRELAVQPVPENIFRSVSVQQVYTEKRIHTFGVYDEPMYRVYLQYMDSAEAREPVIEAWKSTFASNRAKQYGLVFGILIALLGVVSAGLRALSSTGGSRNRSVIAALALTGIGVVTFLLIA